MSLIEVNKQFVVIMEIFLVVVSETLAFSFMKNLNFLTVGCAQPLKGFYRTVKYQRNYST